MLDDLLLFCPVQLATMSLDNTRTDINKVAIEEGAADFPEREPGLIHDDIERHVAVGVDDVAIIPKGEIDPVYEAKARVLNRAACCASTALLEA